MTDSSPKSNECFNGDLTITQLHVSKLNEVEKRFSSNKIEKKKMATQSRVILMIINSISIIDIFRIETRIARLDVLHYR